MTEKKEKASKTKKVDNTEWLDKVINQLAAKNSF